ncbi:MAG: tyrosine-type recombinase/integrase [Candidatus Glassbacteria bacterium]|nr:tyrosine-type recombinase/integrase [Candidatus Glassbacteria bacterium]
MSVIHPATGMGESHPGIRLLKRAKVRYRKFHDIRHTFASHLLSQGESPVYVKEQLGHASIQMTVDIYGHWIRTAENGQAVDRLDE